MDSKNKIEVIIGGSVYTLVGEESQEYMQRIALYIDKKMDELRKTDSSKKLSHNLMAILTSINVADDLFKQREEYKKIIDQLKKFEIENKDYKIAIDEYVKKIKSLEERINQNKNQELIQSELENRINSYKERIHSMEEELEIYKQKYTKVQEELEIYKDELGKVQEENIEYEKLLDEVQLELIQYKNELNQYKHG